MKYKDIIWNAMIDWKKRDIDPFERAMVIKEYLLDTRLSQRQLAEQLGMPHSTLQDWLRWDRITEKEYADMKKRGLNPTDVYRILRNNQNVDKEEFVKDTKLDYELGNVIRIIKPFINNPVYSSKTMSLIKELRNELNRLEMKIEMKMKRPHS